MELIDGAGAGCWNRIRKRRGHSNQAIGQMDLEPSDRGGRLNIPGFDLMETPSDR
tara:strand:- start:235 stop:399 length:165 start_codon:yes stop_codon:yes gene_type:complete